MSLLQGLEKLYEFSALYFALPTPTFKRYLYETINFNAKMIGILGQRGVGKTTLIRQIEQNYDLPASKMLYISADNNLNHWNILNFMSSLVPILFSPKGKKATRLGSMKSSISF